MNRHMILLMVGVLGANVGWAGSIVGTVKAEPPANAPEQAGGGGAYDSRRYKFAERVDYTRLRDFIVYIDQPVATPAPAPQTAAVTTQRDASFDPHVLPIAVGTTVRWPNDDDIYHNVYSDTPVKQFDLDFYKKEKVPEVTFDQVGRVDVFCAIHSKMHCIVLVLPNAFFVRADAKGRFLLKDVPAGTYKVRAWHERFPSQVKEIEVPADGDVHVDFSLGLGGLPKY